MLLINGNALTQKVVATIHKNKQNKNAYKRKHTHTHIAILQSCIYNIHNRHMQKFMKIISSSMSVHVCRHIKMMFCCNNCHVFQMLSKLHIICTPIHAHGPSHLHWAIYPLTWLLLLPCKTFLNNIAQSRKIIIRCWAYVLRQSACMPWTGSAQRITFAVVQYDFRIISKKAAQFMRLTVAGGNIPGGIMTIVKILNCRDACCGSIR